MMYFRPKKAGITVDFGRKRAVRIPMFNIVEIDEKTMVAKIKSYTGAVMIYYGSGIIPIKEGVIRKLLTMGNEFDISNTFRYI